MTPEIRVGCTVEIHGLVGAAIHNGKTGVVERFDEEKGRWGVRLSKDVVLGVKPDNLTVKAPPQGEDDDDDDDRFVRAKRKFDRIRKKYGLDKEPVSDEIADLLTGRQGGTAITAEQFASRFGMSAEEALAFLGFVQMAVEFKETSLDPHNKTAGELRESLASKQA